MATTNCNAGSGKKATKAFSWTDEECALLLHVIIDYKASKSAQGLDWDTIKNKYEEITARLQDRYPKENSGVSAEEFPNCADPTVLRKDRIMAKVKRVKGNFRKAVDSARRSGGGRVVLALYDECNEIWAGSPAVESIYEGIESSILTQDNCPIETSSSVDIEAQITDSEKEGDCESNDLQQKESIEKVGETRRNLIKHLKEKRDGKLTKRLAVDAQLLDIAKQEIALKKIAQEKMEEDQKQHNETMKMYAASMNSLTSVISNGFNMLQGFLNPNLHQQQQPTYGTFHPTPNNSNANGSRNAEFNLEFMERYRDMQD